MMAVEFGGGGRRQGEGEVGFFFLVETIFLLSSLGKERK